MEAKLSSQIGECSGDSLSTGYKTLHHTVFQAIDSHHLELLTCTCSYYFYSSKNMIPGSVY